MASGARALTNQSRRGKHWLPAASPRRGKSVFLMRLMQVLAGGRHGGAETFYVNLVKHLHEAGVTQKPVVRGWPERLTDLRDAGLNPIAVPFRGALDPITPWRLHRIEKQWQPDAVMTWMSRASGAMHTRRAPHVARVGHYYKIKYFGHCDALIAIAPGIADHFAELGFPRERIHVVPNYTDHRPQDPMPRDAFDTPAEAPHILALGRLHRNKGFDVLLAALSGLPGVFVWFAGDGPERDPLEQQARDLGIADRVRFLGWRTDVSALIQASDVVAMPSRHEGFGTVILEAWAHGVPLVAAASQGPRDVVRDGETGLLVPVDDTMALGAALRRVLFEPSLAEDLAAAARTEYVARYSRTAVIQQYISTLSEISRLGKIKQ